MNLAQFDQFVNCTVAVIGDIMLDVYLRGDVTRISPEAPVPILRWQSESTAPGGAANVAANIAALGAQAILVGVIGEDGAATDLSRIWQTSPRVSVRNVVRDANRETIRKMRVLGHNQQILRIDREGSQPLDASIEAELIVRTIAAIDMSDIVVLSDYRKGTLTDKVLQKAIAHALAVGKLVIVDPKRADLSCYKDASLITPNRSELALATGLHCETDEEALAAVIAAQKVCNSEVLLTRSERGMSYFPKDGQPVHFPTMAREVFDVSGAGDTVVAVVAAALSAQFTMVDAISASNHAAGIVVGRVGTATVSRDQLTSSFAATLADQSPDGRLVSFQEAKLLREIWRHQSLTVGFTNGCFDIIHPGHVSLIRQAAQACDRLIVALNTDASVRRLKGPNRPTQNEIARAEVVGALKGVSLVVLFNEDTPYDLVSGLQPDVLIKGADYAEAQVVGADVVRARGGKIILAELVDGQSTTRLLEAIR